MVLRFNIPVVVGSVLGLQFSMPSLQAVFVVLRFNIPITSGIVLGSVVEYALFTWNVRGFEVQHAHH